MTIPKNLGLLAPKVSNSGTVPISTISDVDVATITPTNGQTLVWNAATSKWIPGAGGGPKIATVSVTDSSYTVLDDTAVDTAGGYIKITGSGFATGCQVLVNSLAVTSVTFISSTEVRAQVPATAAGTYIIYVVNTDGGIALKVNGITFSDLPSWVTASSLPENVQSTAINIQLSATSATTFALASGSSLPSGVTLSSGGLLSGTVTGLTNNTIYNFSIVATDAELQDSPRTFSINIVVGDLYWKYTSLLLKGDPTVTPFNADSSTNKFALTLNGDPKPNSITPYLGNGYYSTYFNGSTDSFTVSNNTAFNLPSDFTLECWVYLTTASGTKTIWTNRTSYANATGLTWLMASGSQAMSIYTASGFSCTSSISVALNTWTHIALTRSVSTITQWVNGVSSAAVTNSSVFSDANCFLAVSDSSSERWPGYISNFRIVKGTAVYTSTFTPSTAPLTAIANTSLLTCQSNRFIDNSSNAFAISIGGTPTVSQQRPFSGSTGLSTYGSTYFNGSSDYIIIPDDATWVLGNNFTIECWVYFNSTAGIQQFLTQRVDVSSAWQFLYNYPTAGDLTFKFADSNVAINMPWSPVANRWYHIAVCRNGNSWYLFSNGTQLGTATNSTTFPDIATSVTIGRIPSGEYFNGYISNLRVVKSSLYTAAFTPPTAPLTAVTNTQLLTLQTNGGTHNNTFLDSSNNNLLVTRSGNSTQGSFSPYGNNWSNYFNGTSSYLSLSDNAVFQMGTGDFTIECWVNPSSVPATDSRIWSYQSAGSATVLNLYMLASGTGSVFSAELRSSTGTANVQTSGTTTAKVGTWYHVAFIRSNGSTKLFVNGVQEGTTQTSQTQNLGSGVPAIGYYPAGSSAYFPGYISNFRVVKGTAVYTSTFTPSTAPLTAIANTSLLTCQSNRFIDNSTNAFAITTGGSPIVQRFTPLSVSSPYDTSVIGGSAYFDGTGDYLLTASNAAFTLAGDFTIEGWMYMTAGANDISLFTLGDANASTGIQVYYYNSAIRMYSGATIISSSNTPNFNAWVHVAMVRSGTTVTLYLNGVSNGTATRSTTYSGAFYTGASSVGPGEYMNGYISNLRIVNGTAVYTTTFTPPTAPLTAITNTSYLLNFTGGGVYDSTTQNDLETAGNVQISTSVYKYGSGSMYFNGTNAGLLAPSSTAFALGSSDFTIEFWYYPTSTAGTNPNILCNNNSGTFSSGYWSLHAPHSSYANKYSLWVASYSTAGALLVSTSNIATNTWTHFTITRSGNTWRMFINGTIEATATSTAALDSGGANPQYIGYQPSVESGRYITGYLDDLRITKGIARYTANFTAPTSSFLSQ